MSQTSVSQTSIVNHRETRIVGLSRSGNHAIVEWIRRQAEGRVCFLNCVEPKTNPYQTARPTGDGRRGLASYSEFDIEQEAAGCLSKKDLLIFSYEDCFLTMVCHRDFERHHDQWLGASRQRFDVLILRDPFNLFASRLRSQYTGVTPKTMVRIWKQHARQFLGERNYVTQEFLPISYNRWTADAGYRRQIAEQLGLRFNDAGSTRVPATGGGSSFDGQRFDGVANVMDVFGRWRHFQDDDEYRRLFDAETLRLSKSIFGSVEDSEEFQRFLKSLG